MNILFQESGVEYVLKHLKNIFSYRWNSIKNINQGRYTIVKSDIYNIAIIMKRNWFLKFSLMGFKKLDGTTENSLGDTINVNDLKQFIQDGVRDIMILFKTGDIYRIPLERFLKYSHRWINKEGKEVRSISIHCYEKIHKNFDNDFSSNTENKQLDHFMR